MTKSLFILMGLGGVASANAFYLAEHDAKETGRGDTGAATDTDPSAIAFNPGGMAVGEGTHFSLGAALISPQASFTPDPQYNTGKYDSTTSSAILPNLFVTHKINDLIAVGGGFHAPFGLAIDWPSNSLTADNSQSSSIRSYYLTAAVGVDLDKILPGLSAGAGLDIVPATVELNQAIYFGADHTCVQGSAGTNCGSAHLGATATGFGGRVGVMWRPKLFPKISLGAAYFSQVKLDFSGTGDFDAPAPFRSQLPPDGDVSTSVTLPQRFVGGVAYRPTDKIEVEANVSWVNWAKFNELDIKLPNGMDQVQQESYHNTTTLRLGAEYTMPALRLALRVGYIYDPTPIDDKHLFSQLPDVDRNDLTAGASYSLGDYDFHVGLLWVLPTSRKTANDPMDPNAPQYKGTYDVSAFVASAQFTGKFGK
jgi:long-chain fatty acid transport protein